MIWMWEWNTPHALFDHERSALPTVRSSAFVLPVRFDEDAADVPATPTGLYFWYQTIHFLGAKHVDPQVGMQAEANEWQENCFIRDILVFFMGISKDDGDFLMQNAITTAQPLGVMDPGLSVVSTDCPDFRCFFLLCSPACDDQSDLDVSWPVQENCQTKLRWFRFITIFWGQPSSASSFDQVLCGWVWVICNASVRLLTRTAGDRRGLGVNILL